MASFDSLTLQHSTTVDRVAEELRRALFDGELPPGTALREVALASAMGVSRSTIREGLAVLVAEGLATRAPNRGVHVTSLDPDAVHDVSRAREVLELAGVRRWTEASPDARDACRRALTEFVTVAEADPTTDPTTGPTTDRTTGPGHDPGRLTAAHLAIHQSFVGLTESTRLVAVADSLASEIRLGLARVDRIRRNAEDQVTSHRLLLELLEAGDVEAAATELGRHLTHAESSMLGALDLTPG